jgi:hypothetical protein
VRPRAAGRGRREKRYKYVVPGEYLFETKASHNVHLKQKTFLNSAVLVLVAVAVCDTAAVIWKWREEATMKINIKHGGDGRRNKRRSRERKSKSKRRKGWLTLGEMFL